MYCPKCQIGDIYGTMLLNLEFFLNKGGGIDLERAKLTHSVLKKIWSESPKICVCEYCGAKYRYISNKRLEFIPFREAKKKKYSKLRLLHFS